MISGLSYSPEKEARSAHLPEGARKPGNALSGVINPFSFGEFTVYEGRTSYTLVSASISIILQSYEKISRVLIMAFIL